MTLHIKLPGVEFEAGSFGEALAIVQDDPKSPDFFAFVTQLDQAHFNTVATLVPPGATQDAPADTEASDVAEPGKKRGRRSKAQIAADEAAAAAALAASGPTPPPLPSLPGVVTQTTEPPIPTMEALPYPSVAVTLPGPPPAAPAPAPVPAATGTDGLELPGFLDRRGQPAPTPSNPTPNTDAPAPAPVPVVTLPPPPAPAPPPAMPALILGPKVADKLLASKSGLTDGGAAWLNWLYGLGVIPNAEKTTFDEAIAVIRLTVDAVIKPVADHLGVTA